MSRAPLGRLTGVTALVLAVATASPALAQCPGQDGTVPGTGPSVTAVGAGEHVVYVDDRGLIDWDDDGDAGGIWIYLESNGMAGLQRGGTQVVLAELPPVTYPSPIPVLPPDPNRPVLPNGLTLFPCCHDPGQPAEIVGLEDDCRERWPPDTLLL